MSQSFHPQHVNLTDTDPSKVICYLSSLEDGHEDINAKLRLRIGAIFLLLVFSTLGTLVPLIFRPRKGLCRIGREFYHFARQFGAGVILATAFMHLLASAYEEIGPDSCVGMTGNWKGYPWAAAIILATIMFMFLLHTGAQQYVKIKYGKTPKPAVAAIADVITDQPRAPQQTSLPRYRQPAPSAANGQSSSSPQDTGPSVNHTPSPQGPPSAIPVPPSRTNAEVSEESLIKDEENQGGMEPKNLFPQQLATFCILELCVLFHSSIIGINLGSNSSSELVTLLVPLTFHQLFEGLGVGARLSDIEFPEHWNWLRGLFCVLYGSITSIFIAVGLGVRHSYGPGSFTAKIVSGVLDSASCGILTYTGLVELLAKDFIFFEGEESTKRLDLTAVYVCFGVLIMSLLAKWV